MPFRTQHGPSLPKLGTPVNLSASFLSSPYGIAVPTGAQASFAISQNVTCLSLKVIRR